MLKPLVIANWKMNPTTLRAARALFSRVRRGIRGARGIEIAIAPPFPYLGFIQPGRGLTLAAQDVFWEPVGAWTGEVSPAMLCDLGVRYCIIGHSERRKNFGESDEAVNRKIKAALKFGLIPVIAVGEETPESQEVVPPILFQQLSRALLGIPKRWLGRTVIAYEPVWAIGSGKPDTPDNATRRAIYIRKLLIRILGRRIADAIRIIYGGSVNAQNAASFLSRDIRGMEGLLVGGASLDAEEFIRIVQSVAARPHCR